MKSSDTDAVYLDYASATPVRQAVKAAMEPYWSDNFANPQSSHSYGQQAKAAVEEARATIADVLSVQPSELVFTSGATEANALAVRGRVRAFDRENTDVITTQTAHATQRHFSTFSDITLKELSVGDDGRVQPNQLKSAVSDQTAVISMPYVNNEIGTIQPSREIRMVLNDLIPAPVLHWDASQAGLYLSLRPDDIGADMLTINSQKLYGPKGVGLLWVRSGTEMASILPTDRREVVGDYQLLRPGTPPVPLIVGFAKALLWAQENYNERANRIATVRDFAFDQLDNEFPHVVLNGSREHRIANNISVSFPDTDHDYLATKLDRAGIVVSPASACQSTSGDSRVISALPGSNNTAIRITLGKDTKKTDIRKLIQALKRVR